MKISLESLNLKSNGCTINTLDIINMYPSIKHKLIRKAINHFCMDRLNEEEEVVIAAALEMQQFSMGNTIVTFRDKFYEYGVNADPMERGLTIGGYDSAWLADMVAGYLLELADDHFAMTSFFGMYRDDGNVIFEGEKSNDDIKDWLAHFQAKVNEDVGGNDIQFTMDIWRPGKPSETIVPKILKVVGTEIFPYLDIGMKFDESQDLYFELYSKPGYTSKYLNLKSHHPASCKKAVPRGVSIRLAGLTTETAQNSNLSLSTIYPKVHKALQTSGYLTGDSKLPKLGGILSSRERERMEAICWKEEWSKDKRNTYCLTKYDGNWRTPIHKTIKQLRDNRGLKWLRVRMVYKRHQNVKEMLLGDLQTKTLRGIVTVEYEKKTRKGKCTCREKVNGQCIYKSECETVGVVYQITCKCCDSIYIGKTQRTLKKRTMEHYTTVGKIWQRRQDALRNLNAPAPSTASISVSSNQSARTTSLAGDC